MAFPSLTFLQNEGFTVSDGYTSQDSTPRLLADINADGLDDIVGFSEDAVYVSYQLADGLFTQYRELTFGQVSNFTGLQGYTDNTYVRTFGDVDGDGDDDLLAFTPTGIQLSINAGTDLTTDYRNDSAVGFQTAAGVTITAAVDGTNFTDPAQWTNQDETPRYFTDIDGDGDADLIGFGLDNTYYALGNGDGTFASGEASGFWDGAADQPFFSVDQGWTSDNSTPRLLGDLNGDGWADIIGFAQEGIDFTAFGGTADEGGVFVALSELDGTFGTPTQLTIGGTTDFFEDVWSSQDETPFYLVDIDNSGDLDIVGFGPSSIFYALGDGAGGFAAFVELESDAFTAASGFGSNNETPRFFTDLNGDTIADILGFGQSTVSSSENVFATDPTIGFDESTTTTIGAPSAFTINDGGWTSQTETTRFLTDVDGDGDDDILGFGLNNVYISVNEGGSFVEPVSVTITGATGFTSSNGGWSDQNLATRLIGDVNNDGRADIIGFGGGGTVFRALGTGTGFGTSSTISFTGDTTFTTTNGWTSQDETPRFLVDLNNDGFDDLIGFGGTSVFVSMNNAGIFGAVEQIEIGGATGFTINNGGWASQTQTPRLLGDITGDGFADIVGFGGASVFVAEGVGDGTFGDATAITFDGGTQFTIAQGWADNNVTPRELTDIDGDGALDIVGFGGNFVFASLNDGSGNFGAVQQLDFDGLSQFNINNGGWANQDTTPRFFGEIDGSAGSELLAFGGNYIFGADVTA
ncbi:FG-GAP repeat protein [Rippkaea orientalis PCC 8801]|uniref:FG-GAP repeat protein n=1 Tax=Rippkaea orientalis (strain PCC 8801 / RF-1) TaxID=41431 RepID=B7JW86_RIPO1|nr:VCBS repeat-containing protein [Rippkaea orientalis]ACK66931.1 FG-GAP repeat protein [Rippkaea orientalis PCC 8801]